VNPESVSFRHEKPRDTSRHQAFFGAAIRWEAPLAEMRFRAEDLALPVKSRDPALHAFLVRAADTALEQHRPPDTFLDRVRKVVAELLPSGGLDIDRAAAKLGTTSRTLRRRLAGQDTSFSQVRDEVRRALAESYLAERSLPIEEVAFLLDFGDERAFRRSFQRWTGKSPARFRAER
jgi:AraC-like DNA-binding protein